MENTNTDNFVKHAMADSYTTLNNTSFNDMVMRKIMQVEKRRTAIRVAADFIPAAILSAALIFFIFQKIQQNITGISSQVTRASGKMLQATENSVAWLAQCQYFILPFIVMLVLKQIFDRQDKRRVTA